MPASATETIRQRPQSKTSSAVSCGVSPALEGASPSPPTHPDFPPGFGSDNHSGAWPEVMAALGAVNVGHAPSYGTDPVTLRSIKCFREVFGPHAQVAYVFNGTAANVLSLRLLTRPYHAVLCSDISHLQMDECGAPEWATGCKLLTVPHEQGKITPQALRRHLVRKGDQHYAQPRVLSVTQPTELGTVYSLEELRALVALAREHDLCVHMDGARLLNAAAALNCSLQAMTTDVGIDVLSFGGTKNGLVFGEAVVLLSENARKHGQALPYLRKQSLQLPSKTRFVAAQFEVLLNENLWRPRAQHARAMAHRLASAVANLEGITVTQPVESNAVFAVIPKSVHKALRKHYFFYVWDEHTWEVRFMTSFDTQPEDVDRFAALAAQAAANASTTTATTAGCSA